MCKQAESFIKSHPASPASAYILQRYFSQSANPNLDLIARLAEPLTGKVKDCRVLNEVLQKLPEKEKHIGLPKLHVRKEKKWRIFVLEQQWHTKQYSLINFWASWDKESLEIKDSLYTLCEKFSKTIFGLSTSHWIITRKNGRKIPGKIRNNGLRYATIRME